MAGPGGSDNVKRRRVSGDPPPHPDPLPKGERQVREKSSQGARTVPDSFTPKSTPRAPQPSTHKSSHRLLGLSPFEHHRRLQQLKEPSYNPPLHVLLERFPEFEATCGKATGNTLYTKGDVTAEVQNAILALNEWERLLGNVQDALGKLPADPMELTRHPLYLEIFRDQPERATKIWEALQMLAGYRILFEKPDEYKGEVPQSYASLAEQIVEQTTILFEAGLDDFLAEKQKWEADRAALRRLSTSPPPNTTLPPAPSPQGRGDSFIPSPLMGEGQGEGGITRVNPTPTAEELYEQQVQKKEKLLARFPTLQALEGDPFYRQILKSDPAWAHQLRLFYPAEPDGTASRRLSIPEPETDDEFVATAASLMAARIDDFLARKSSDKKAPPVRIAVKPRSRERVLYDQLSCLRERLFAELPTRGVLEADPFYQHLLKTDRGWAFQLAAIYPNEVNGFTHARVAIPPPKTDGEFALASAGLIAARMDQFLALRQKKIEEGSFDFHTQRQRTKNVSRSIEKIGEYRAMVASLDKAAGEGDIETALRIRKALGEEIGRYCSEHNHDFIRETFSNIMDRDIHGFSYHPDDHFKPYYLFRLKEIIGKLSWYEGFLVTETLREEKAALEQIGTEDEVKAANTELNRKLTQILKGGQGLKPEEVESLVQEVRADIARYSLRFAINNEIRSFSDPEGVINKAYRDNKLFSLSWMSPVHYGDAVAILTTARDLLDRGKETEARELYLRFTNHPFHKELVKYLEASEEHAQFKAQAVKLSVAIAIVMTAGTAAGLLPATLNTAIVATSTAEKAGVFLSAGLAMVVTERGLNAVLLGEQFLHGETVKEQYVDFAFDVVSKSVMFPFLRQVERMAQGYGTTLYRLATQKDAPRWVVKSAGFFGEFVGFQAFGTAEGFAHTAIIDEESHYAEVAEALYSPEGLYNQALFLGALKIGNHLASPLSRFGAKAHRWLDAQKRAKLVTYGRDVNKTQEDFKDFVDGIRETHPEFDQGDLSKLSESETERLMNIYGELAKLQRKRVALMEELGASPKELEAERDFLNDVETYYRTAYNIVRPDERGSTDARDFLGIGKALDARAAKKAIKARFARKAELKTPKTGSDDAPTVILRSTSDDSGTDFVVRGRNEIPVGRTHEHGGRVNIVVVKGDERTSRCHCRIHRKGDLWLIEDLGSSHGTFVNGRDITGEHVTVGEEVFKGAALKPGDKIRIGDSEWIFGTVEPAVKDLSPEEVVLLHSLGITHLQKPGQVLNDFLDRLGVLGKKDPLFRSPEVEVLVEKLYGQMDETIREVTGKAALEQAGFDPKVVEKRAADRSAAASSGSTAKWPLVRGSLEVKGKTALLDPYKKISIGGGPFMTYSANDPAITGEAAQISYSQDTHTWHLVPMNNVAVKVNGKKIKGSVELKGGEEIGVGKWKGRFGLKKGESTSVAGEVTHGAMSGPAPLPSVRHFPRDTRGAAPFQLIEWRDQKTVAYNSDGRVEVIVGRPSSRGETPDFTLPATEEMITELPAEGIMRHTVISRQHARIYDEDGKFYVEVPDDPSSLDPNLTKVWVNGLEVQPGRKGRREVQDDQDIHFGYKPDTYDHRHLHFIFKLVGEEARPVAEPSPPPARPTAARGSATPRPAAAEIPVLEAQHIEFMEYLLRTEQITEDKVGPLLEAVRTRDIVSAWKALEAMADHLVSRFHVVDWTRERIFWTPLSSKSEFRGLRAHVAGLLEGEIDAGRANVPGFDRAHWAKERAEIAESERQRGEAVRARNKFLGSLRTGLEHFGAWEEGNHLASLEKLLTKKPSGPEEEASFEQLIRDLVTELGTRDDVGQLLGRYGRHRDGSSSPCPATCAFFARNYGPLNLYRDPAPEKPGEYPPKFFVGLLKRLVHHGEIRAQAGVYNESLTGDEGARRFSPDSKRLEEDPFDCPGWSEAVVELTTIVRGLLRRGLVSNEDLEPLPMSSRDSKIPVEEIPEILKREFQRKPFTKKRPVERSDSLRHHTFVGHHSSASLKSQKGRGGFAETRSMYDAGIKGDLLSDPRMPTSGPEEGKGPNGGLKPVSPRQCLQEGWLFDLGGVGDRLPKGRSNPLDENGNIGRFYFAVRPEYRALFWEKFTRVLDEAFDSGYAFQAKIDPTGTRVAGDPSVLYFRSGHTKGHLDQIYFYDLVVRTMKEECSPEWFFGTESRPVFAAQVLDYNGNPIPGVSFMQDPHQKARSANDIRAHANALGYRNARYLRALAASKGKVLPEDLEFLLMANALHGQDIDPWQPAFNLATDGQPLPGKDLFDFIRDRTDQRDPGQPKERARPAWLAEKAARAARPVPHHAIPTRPELIRGDEIHPPKGMTKILFGRSSQSDLVLPHSTVSRKHGSIEQGADGQWYLEVYSENGLGLVRSDSREPKLIKKGERVPLHDGDHLIIGANAYEFTFRPPR